MVDIVVSLYIMLYRVQCRAAQYGRSHEITDVVTWSSRNRIDVTFLKDFDLETPTGSVDSSLTGTVEKLK